MLYYKKSIPGSSPTIFYKRITWKKLVHFTKNYLMKVPLRQKFIKKPDTSDKNKKNMPKLSVCINKQTFSHLIIYGPTNTWHNAIN